MALARARRRPPQGKPKQPRKKARFTPEDFTFDPDSKTCVCPAGKPLWLKSANARISGYTAVTFEGYRRYCGTCPLRTRCLRKPDRVRGRQVAFITGGKRCRGRPRPKKIFSIQMKQKIDTEEGRAAYDRRFGIVEPVFGHIKAALGLNRFSLRGKKKVNIQWLLYCLVHNIGKIQQYGTLKFG